MTLRNSELKITIQYAGENSDLLYSRIAALQEALFSEVDFYLDPETGEQVDITLLRELKVKNIIFLPDDTISTE